MSYESLVVSADDSRLTTHDLILASASPRRLQLLQSIGIKPAHIVAPDIDETPRKGELALDYAKRMALEKADAVQGNFVLAADTVVACGRRILPKGETEALARACLKQLANRRHKVITGVCVRKDGVSKVIAVTTLVQFGNVDIDAYIATAEWEGKAGGYAIQGAAAAFTKMIRGSYTNVVGLPLYEVLKLLRQ